MEFELGLRRAIETAALLGKRVTGEFDYDTFHFWTSLYVRATIHSIEWHAVERGDIFWVRFKVAEEKKHHTWLALFTVITFLTKIFVQACRGMREDQPEMIQDLFKMMKKFDTTQSSR